MFLSAELGLLLLFRKTESERVTESNERNSRRDVAAAHNERQTEKKREKFQKKQCISHALLHHSLLPKSSVAAYSSSVNDNIFAASM